MANYIQTNLRYDKMQENGVVKKVTEAFLVNALSFTEAEARITQEQTPFISGDFTVSAVKKTKISEIFFNESADKFYLAKVGFITIDEKTAVEKRNVSLILVQADAFGEAYESLKDGMKGIVSDYEVVSLSETNILDVYRTETAE